MFHELFQIVSADILPEEGHFRYMRRSGSILVARNALTRRAEAESHDSSGFAVIESRASRATCFASELSPSSWTRRRSQSVAVTCRTCVDLHCPEMRYTTTGWDSVNKQYVGG